MPRPDFLAIEAINEPSYEETLRAYANWLRSRALLRIPGVPTAITIDADFANWIANALETSARLHEANG